MTLNDVMAFLRWLRGTVVALRSLTHKASALVPPCVAYVARYVVNLIKGHYYYFAVRCKVSQLGQLSLLSFRCDSPCLWNQLPLSLRQPHSGTSSSISDSPILSPIASSTSDSPLCTSRTHAHSLPT